MKLLHVFAYFVNRVQLFIDFTQYLKIFARIKTIAQPLPSTSTVAQLSLQGKASSKILALYSTLLSTLYSTLARKQFIPVMGNIKNCWTNTNTKLLTQYKYQYRYRYRYRYQYQYQYHYQYQYQTNSDEQYIFFLINTIL